MTTPRKLSTLEITRRKQVRFSDLNPGASVFVPTGTPSTSPTSEENLKKAGERKEVSPTGSASSASVKNSLTEEKVEMTESVTSPSSVSAKYSLFSEKEMSEEEKNIHNTLAAISLFLEEAGVKIDRSKPYSKNPYLGLISKGLTAPELQTVFSYCRLLKERIDLLRTITKKEFQLQCMLYISFLTLSKACELGSEEKNLILKCLDYVPAYFKFPEKLEILMRTKPEDPVQQRIQKLFYDIQNHRIERTRAEEAAFAEREKVFLAGRERKM